MSQKLYATIRPGTRYESQCNGEAFPVEFQPDSEGYHWRGGIGGRYRHSDLQLWVMGKNAKLEGIPLTGSAEGIQLIDIILKGWEDRAITGDLCPEWMTKYGDELIQRIKKLQVKATETYPEEEDY